MEGGAKMSIPPLFRCPISLELFTDPVTLCTGQTYDRPSIERWIASGNLTCPVTMQRLHDLSMVPNHTLSHLIHLWLNQTTHKAPPLDPTDDDDHDAYLFALKETLESQEPIWERKLQALVQVKALALELPESADSDSNTMVKFGLFRFGFFPVLIKLVFEGEYDRLELVELALTSAVKLMPLMSDLGCLNVLKKRSSLVALSTLLEQGTPLIKILLCHILEALLSSSSIETKEVSTMIIASPDIQPSIINLTLLALDQDPYGHESAKVVSQAGVKVISAFCIKGPEEALVNMVEFGAIKGLTRHILGSLDTEGGSAVAAVAALEALVAAEGGKEALLGEPGGVKALVKMVFRVSDHQGCESAVNGLVGVCSGSDEAREEAVKAGALTQLLLLMQSQCSCQAKAKAAALLRMLGSWDCLGCRGDAQKVVN